MTFSGDLSGIGLPDVFQNLAGNRSTGTLHVRWDKGERYVRFHEGQVAGWSLGPGKNLPLFDHVAERGLSDQQDLQTLLASLRRRRKRPARLLLDEKLLDQQGLVKAFREIVAEGIYELLTLSAAQFAFKANEPADGVFDPDLLAANVRLEIGPLLLEGARRADELQRIRSVVGSDQDLFVADPKAAERAPDEASAAVASVLDGRTDVAGIARLVRQSRFAVSCALLTLVQQGLARPATGDEIAALAEQALSANEREEAIRLLGQALVRMPRDAVLRRRLAETLASIGRKREAAGEMAVLAFQAIEEERFQDALSCYDRAIALDPADVALHQRRVDLIKKLGDRTALRTALLLWAQRLEGLGLADRACDVLTGHVDSGPLRGDQQLLLRLAELSKATGNVASAAARYVQIVDLHGAGDLNLSLRCLRAALAAQPDDPGVKKRLHDIESGRAMRRRRRRRQWTAGGLAAAVVLAALLFAGQELAASRRLAAILRDRPADVLGVATLPGLRELAAEHSYVPSCRLAGVIAGEEAMRLLRAAGEFRLQGRIDDALSALAIARESLPETAAARAEALTQQLRTETPLYAWLQRVERRGRDDGEACEALARATGPEFLEFHCDQLARASCDATRQSLLRALQVANDPRCAASVARAYLATNDQSVARMAEGLLQNAIRGQPRRVQEQLDPILREGRDHPERRARAERIVELLSAHLAAPGK